MRAHPRRPARADARAADAEEGAIVVEGAHCEQSAIARFRRRTSRREHHGAFRIRIFSDDASDEDIDASCQLWLKAIEDKMGMNDIDTSEW